MRIVNTVLLFCMLALCSSCFVPRNVAYFQDAAYIHGMAVRQEQQFRLRPADKVNIVVNSNDPLLESQFTLSSVSQRNILGATSAPNSVAGRNSAGGSNTVLAYTVDEQGDIMFPVLGKVHVIGLTRSEVADMIKRRLWERDLVRDAVVTVEYVNMGVSILGEVNHPGRIDIHKDSYTIVDAITDAGDLTINGLRDCVMVFRQQDGEDLNYLVNLCSRQEMISSPAYYLQQNDVVYVLPNNKRMREAQVLGNTALTPSFWISVASLLTTIAALIL